eukprot:TRINITY_DN11964_c0_g2_i2.p1 TRINITY_DN11964_c0_g2~~TRINITY_DN11964_c0_g2_i2.p1  ORF type:complete len:116 (-),score=15.04 TRINITY_DN11964_c0_g2_i2:634-948(-)
MSTREIERTDEFLGDLINKPTAFKTFLSSVSKRLKVPGTITSPLIERAVAEAYGDNDLLPPDAEIIHYVFDGLVFTKPTAIKESVLANLLKQLIIEHRNDINKE